MHVLRQGLPAPGDRGSRLCRLRADGRAAIPLRTDTHIMWTIKFRDGEIKRFKFPVRTTPVGSIDPYKDKPPAGDINSQLLFTEANKQLSTI